ncbi:hypothetical protein IMCC20628_04005 [Hoeflea sp. IMCC20628]|uniref:hypothetical protein n=1 Tax=Hoeflea sp. IMCC20628 TaxID=1620421 RepID=UPI00063ABB29|nr:hypothetical protein [Hoeflea sp. IMCC20628]AKI02685.1 hypothetical protein IMCC20628_04005 [Hoeflea sp. IMCC20628]
MNKNTLKTTTAHIYDYSADSPDLRQRFDELIDEVVSPSLSADALANALAGGVDEIAGVLRAIPGMEGRLIERGIAFVAKCNPDLAVLTQNLRLPVTPAAMQVVLMNNPLNYRTVTFDADMGGRKTYTPDLVILNRLTKVAHLVDSKRSLNSYERARIDELRNRMLAAALVVPDFLYKEHRRMVAEDVRVVILNAENQKTDLEGGIWHLSHLDHLVEVAGAGEAIGLLQKKFRSRIQANWKLACETFSSKSSHQVTTAVDVMTAAEETEPDDEADQTSCGSSGIGTGREPQMIKLGFAQVPIRH